MAVFGLMFLVVALILIGIGIVVGLVACCIAGVLFAVGILSSSVVVGLLTRRPAAGIRAPANAGPAADRHESAGSGHCRHSCGHSVRMAGSFHLLSRWPWMVDFLLRRARGRGCWRRHRSVVGLCFSSITTVGVGETGPREASSD